MAKLRYIKLPPPQIRHPIAQIVCDLNRHLICLPYSTKNLHMMAAQLGLGRHWFHKDHYDIPVKRRVAIESACLIVPSRVIVRVVRNSKVLPLRKKARKRMTDEIQPWSDEPSVKWAENLDHEQILYLYYQNKGVTGLHYCPDWDYMAIHDKSPEFDACTCDMEKLNAKS